MTAADFLDRHLDDQRRGDGHWLAMSELADAFRESSPSQRQWMIDDPPRSDGAWNALLAGIVEDLCEEVAMTPPAWTIGMVAPQPFWVWPNVTEDIKAALRDVTKPVYAKHNVFVPGNLLNRARMKPGTLTAQFKEVGDRELP